MRHKKGYKRTSLTVDGNDDHKKINKRHISPTIDDSSDDDDDIPLKVMQLNERCDKDPNCYDSLCVPSRQPCELCEKESNNRFSSLVHNVKHIIIPLLNQTVYQCEVCLHHFTSTEELTRHQSKKHSLSELISNHALVSQSFNNPEDESYESDLISIVKKEPLNSPIKTKIELTCDATRESVSSEGFSIKNRLIFEEDIISFDDRMLSDLTTDCQVQVELIPPIWEVEVEPPKSAEYTNSVDARVEPPKTVEYTNSVHFSELLKPGVFRCKKCSMRFPSRYESIIHEAQHLYIKNCRIILCKICNQYILGDRSNLLHHKLKTHWYIDTQPKNDTKDITRNDLTLKNLLEANGGAPKPFERKDIGGKIEENGDSEPYTTKITTLKLCDVCFSFCKNSTKANYDCFGELTEPGKRYRCEKCGYQTFVVKLVKRETTYRYSSYAKKKNKGKSNEARLKSISQRFKKMKRKYFVVLFFYHLIFSS